MEHFYVVQCQPQREWLAKIELNNQGFRTFCPVIQHQPRIKRGKLETPKPSAMFPKYLFVSLDLDQDHWRSINGTRGVVRLICMNSEKPSPVPDHVMEQLIVGGEIIQEEKALLPFDLSDTVEFVEGPMLGRKALVTACTNDRVSVLMAWLGSKITTHCEPKMLKFASAN